MEMIKLKYLKFLIKNKTYEHYHSNRSLLEHFIGTHNLLSNWGNPDIINIAGLFHSIYGVKSKYSHLKRFDLRKEVTSQIGISAESLVYLFCSLERGSYLKPKVEDLNNWEHRALVEIEVANIIEQEPYITKYFNDTMRYMESIEEVSFLLTPKGYKSYKKFMKRNKI
jgi:hypothetical protein